MSRKKLIAFALTIAMTAVTLFGCGNGSANSSETKSNTETKINTEANTEADTQINTEINTEESSEMNTETESITDVNGPNVANGFAGEATGFTAAEIVDLMGFGYNVGNSFDAQGGKPDDVSSHETAWGNPVVSKELIYSIADAGFTTVRIPTTWYTYVSKDGSYTISPDYLNRIKEVIDWCYEKDLFIILNLHHEEWLNNAQMVTNKEAIAEEIGALWAQIADFFAEYDQHLIFEGMNEPRLAGTSIEWGGDESAYEAVNYFAQTFTNAVLDNGKGHNPERVLVIPGYAASNSAAVMKSVNIPTYNGEAIKNMVVSVHCYAPYDFCLNTKMKDFKETDSNCVSPINQTFSLIKSEFLDNGIPVIIDETGATGKEDVTARERWASYMSKKATEYGIPICLWDNGVDGTNGGECHSYINRKTAEVVHPTVLEAFFNAKKSTVWKSALTGPSAEFESLFEGTQIFSDANGYTSTKQWDAGYISKGCMETYLEGGKDIVVVYEGSGEPQMVLTSPSLELWWMCLKSNKSELIGDKKVVYFTSDRISQMLEENGVSSYSQLGDMSFVATNGNITTYEIVSVGSEHTALYKVNGATYHIGKDMPKNPSLPHYKFLGWYTTRNYLPGTEFDGTIGDQDVVVYAKLELE